MGLPYLRAGDNLLYGAAVTFTAGATDPTYQPAWLCDGRQRPARATTGTATLKATAVTAGPLGVVVVHNHTIDAARTVTISGDVSASAVGLPVRLNAIPVDLWIPIPAPVTGDEVAIGVTSNSVDLVISELLAGPLRELTYDFLIASTEIGYLDIGTVHRQSLGGSVPNFSRGLVARYIRGDIFVEAGDRDAIMDWYESTREETRPSAICPFPDRLEAWTVDFGAKPTFRTFEHAWMASLVFHEWPRKRWIA